MRRVTTIAVLAAILALGTQFTAPHASAATQPFLISSSVSQSQITAGQSENFTAGIGGADQNQNVLIDIELFNSSGQKIDQKFFDNQTIPANGNVPFQMSTTSASQSGSYHFSVGIFNPGWNGLIQWNDAVQTFTVSGGTTPPGTSTDNSAIVVPTDTLTCFTSTSPASAPCNNIQISQGQTGGILSATAQNTDPNNQHAAIIDLELHDSSGNKVAQNFTQVTLGPGASERGLNLASPNNLAAGTYQFSVGVFNPDWSGPLHWTNNIATLTVSGGATPGTGATDNSAITTPTDVITCFTSSSPASAPCNNIQISQGQTGGILSATAQNTDPNNQHSAIVDLELHDSNGNKVAQNFTQVTLGPGAFQRGLNLASPNNLAAGTYQFSIGVFNPDWSGPLHWLNNIATLIVH